jgi:uncharacterized protein YfaS (alpha-2-macroglobulin family)
MKRTVLLLLVAAAGVWAAAQLGPRGAAWREVDDAIQKGLPKTAIEKLDPIIRDALRDREYPEAVKAIARKIVLEGNIQGNKPEEKITRMQSELARAPQEIKPVLQTILAHWYWHYFQQNRWRFVQRTQTGQAPGTDFTTWDLPRLFREIDSHFQVALASHAALKRIPIATYSELLEKGDMADAYRPTLYDFIAHEALRFYTAGEQAGAKPQDSFEIAADGPVFAALPEFLKWNVDRSTNASNYERAVAIYQDLLAFHQNDTDKSAFLDVELDRLAFGYNVAFGDEKDARYVAAVSKFVETWADHETSARALHAWARVLQGDRDLVQARQLALRGRNVFPNSVGGKLCQNLIGEIESKNLQVTAERVWNAPWPKIEVFYKNVTNIHFRAIRANWDDFLHSGKSQPEHLNDEERKALLARRPVLEWSAALPATKNYLARTHEVPAPEKLEKGFYFIAASVDPKFGDQNNQVVLTDVWVSDLALILRPRQGLIEGFVLNAISGEPVSGAEVTAWQLNNQGKRIAEPKLMTDTNGFFQFAANDRSYLVRASSGGDEVTSHHDVNAYRGDKQRSYEQTIFFTDRALYRPGQTIQYKGICLRVDPEHDNYDLLPRQQVTVVFADPNNKEIERQTRQCNEYGSFSGSFTASRDRLMGRMRIYTSGGPHGNAQFNVEEYKRPKFQVELEAPKVAAKLNEKVLLQGKATAYTGAAIDGAKVRYRVVRNVQFPPWCYWYSWRIQRYQQGSQEIAHGDLQTGIDGSFTIEFVAKPDTSVSPTNEPIFSFTIHADVTDTAGETRSDQRGVRVGYTALEATVAVEEWQTIAKAVEIRLSTQTLDGEPQVAEGSLKVYRLKQPERVHRKSLEGPRYWRYGAEFNPAATGDEDLSNPTTWPLGDLVSERGMTTDAKGEAKSEVKLEVGVYRAIFETQDRFGKKVTGMAQIRVVDPAATKLAIKIPHLLDAPKWSVEPGSDFMALWGTGYDEGRAFIEIEHRHRLVERYWTKPGQTQQEIKRAVTEAMRGGFTLHVTQVRENRAYLESRHVDVPWSNKDLEIKWEHFTSKLQPAQKETWTAVITGRDAQKRVAEMVATLYDESLDAYIQHHWQERFGFFYRDHSTASPQFQNMDKQFQHLHGYWPSYYVHVPSKYRQFPPDLVANYYGYEYSERGRFDNRFARGVAQKGMMVMDADVAAAPAMTEGLADFAGERVQLGATVTGLGGVAAAPGGQPAQPKGPDLSQVSARKNLNETAFFFPHLVSAEDGVVKMEFAMPEALTQWRFMGFAHDKDLRSGFLKGQTVTAKDLMVQPNPPRYLREGDVLEFTVKISNQSDARQTGKVRLTFSDASSNDSVDKALGNDRPELSFDIPAKESRSYSWRLKVPDGLGFLVYKAVAASGTVSDGEEGYLPVLSRRVYLTESLPLPIRGPGTKKFEFTKLLRSEKSDTLQHKGFTVQMVSNPSWYAVMALPYLMKYPYECSEQVFNRLYANALARTIANSDPKIRRIFDQWKGTPALDSPLTKNQDLKSVMIEETPWLIQAQNESQARRNVGILFDANRLEAELARALKQLGEMQLGDGSWPWFPGGPGNDYITLYITTGFGRLRHLGVDVQVQPAIRSLARLDSWIDRIYRDILKAGDKDENHLTPTIALYLYGRSFFLKDRPIAAANKEAVDYFLGQAKKYWLQLANRQSQGHLAIALNRFGEKQTAQGIMKSIRERSVTNEEMGMFWRDTELSWWWYRAPIETQALMIEAFDEVVADAKAVEECKVWLIKQKQTQDWKTTKATADAVYALLLRGRDVLASDALVEVKVGGREIKPEKTEAGTGFYEQKFADMEVKPRFGEVTIKKVDQGVAWGSVHWQYMEDISKVTPHEGTPLKLRKTLYTKSNTAKGPVIAPVKGELNVGDELVVRVELRVDRDMEYVHLKDQRGSGTEPVNVISRYKYQDGLRYYESTRDTASHFFIDYLPKGVYVFEYSTRVQHKGRYQTGVAEIQCMYAPEFNSHSESLPIAVN